MKIREIVNALERLAPLALQESWDNAGLQVGLVDEEARGVLVSLDVTEQVVREAVARGCNVVVSHHPLLFRGVKRLTGASVTYDELQAILLSDKPEEGIRRLAKRMGLDVTVRIKKRERVDGLTFPFNK